MFCRRLDHGYDWSANLLWNDAELIKHRAEAQVIRYIEALGLGLPVTRYSTVTPSAMASLTATSAGGIDF
jgi:hypothetical protein